MGMVSILLGIIVHTANGFKVLKKLIHAKHSEKLFLLLLHYYFIICFSFVFWPYHVACSILVPWSGIKMGKLWEMVRDREAWSTAVHGVWYRVGYNLATEQQQGLNLGWKHGFLTIGLPGKFLLYYFYLFAYLLIEKKVKALVTQSYRNLWDPMDLQPARLLCP